MSQLLLRPVTPIWFTAVERRWMRIIARFCDLKLGSAEALIGQVLSMVSWPRVCLCGKKICHLATIRSPHRMENGFRSVNIRHSDALRQSRGNAMRRPDVPGRVVHTVSALKVAAAAHRTHEMAIVLSTIKLALPLFRAANKRSAKFPLKHHRR
jgi:hypothetical protein